MVRRLVAKWFGFDREIESLEEKLRELGWDDCFNMYTRTAFRHLCETQPRGKRVLVFLDFDRIHHLNQIHGYEEVNRRIRVLFSDGFRRGDIRGRHFSGDEIAILLDTADTRVGELVMEKLRERAAALGLSFTHALCAWAGDTNLADAVNGLAETVLRKKRARTHAEGGSHEPVLRNARGN